MKEFYADDNGTGDILPSRSRADFVDTLPRRTQQARVYYSCFDFDRHFGRAWEEDSKYDPNSVLVRRKAITECERMQPLHIESLKTVKKLVIAQPCVLHVSIFWAPQH